MELAIGAALIAIAGYSMWHEGIDAEDRSRKRLCDYYVTGGVFEDAKTVIGSGRRLLEVHLYADENGKPTVAKTPLNAGFDYTTEYWTFDSVCVDLIQAWASSSEPFILSIVPHTTNKVTLNLAGVHNVRNALAAIAVATELAIGDAAIQQALATFQGIDRRLQWVGDILLGDVRVPVIDDYGHHPTELANTCMSRTIHLIAELTARLIA
jgi:UDP-N-acetylmuramate-alanine ligase